MKVTYNWLKDFVNIRLSPQELASRLTMAGLEVTSLEKRQGDFVFEIEVTANRADLLSVRGIAREVAATTNSKLKLLHATRYRPQAKNVERAACSAKPISIDIENKKDCPLYTAKIIKDVKVGPSPDWLKKRLQLLGCRSVNNIVDITNYILFEYGEPLHVFDLDKLNDETIFVRRAKQAEKITTIDGELKMLNPEILVIADKERPIAIAGIIGGQDTEVTEDTKNILLEAAIFNPITVRHSRQNLGLQSESSYRFERGIDLEIVEAASLGAVELIEKFSGGRCVLAKSSGLARAKRKNIKLEVSSGYKILGVSISGSRIKKILNSLGFKVTAKSKNNFIVSVPTHRADVNLEIDLIEEIARIFGYENIVKTLPQVRPQESVYTTRDLVSLTKNILIGSGLNEVITYGLMDKDLLLGFRLDNKPIEILNPLSREQEILRPSLLPSLCSCVAHNLNLKQDHIRIFEIANVFLGPACPQERLALGISLCGTRSYVSREGLVKEEMGFLHLKGILEVLFEKLGIKDYSINAKADPFILDISVQQEKVGILTRLPKDTLDKLNIKNKEVFGLELFLERVFAYAQLKKKFVLLPKYPSISRDISFILKESVSVKEVLGALEEKGRPLLRNIKIVDYYKGKQIPPGFRGLTISCIYRADERTLTETEINPVHALITAILVDKFSAQIR